MLYKFVCHLSLREQVQWRRDKVQELCSKGYNQIKVGNILQIGLATVNRDVWYLRSPAKTNIKRYIDQRLPEEYEKCLVGLTAILREAWTIASQQTEDRREKIQALSLAKECYSMKLDLLTNATVVDDAIRFASENGITILTSKTDHIAISEKIQQEGEAGEKITTTNQIF